MRILLAHDSIDTTGGVEAYLAAIVPGLEARGHEVALLHHWQARSAVTVVVRGETVCVEGMGLDAAIARLRRWQPDVCFSHNMGPLETERRLLDEWPVVKMMHGYFGTCISGLKTHAFPSMCACTRTFGAACVALYGPRRCGQLSAGQLARGYRWTRDQRALFPRYAAIVVASEHMRGEYVRNGADPSTLHTMPLFSTLGVDGCGPAEAGRYAGRHTTGPAEAGRYTGRYTTGPAEAGRYAGRHRMGPAEAGRYAGRYASHVESGFSRTTGDIQPPSVLFAGRMTTLKGGHVLVEAVARASAQVGTPVALIMAGDGPQREEWRRLAEARGVAAEFTGWIPAESRRALYERAAVVALPSLWPEPFGLIGLEAGSLGIPAVAFDTGGVREWLDHGRNGWLVDPSAGAAGFASALASVLGDPDLRRRLADESRAAAARLSLQAHLDRLEPHLAAVRREAAMA